MRAENDEDSYVMVGKVKPKRRHPDELTREEGWELLDRAARRYLNMSAEEFLRAWDAHEFENPDVPEVLRVAMLIPFAR